MHNVADETAYYFNRKIPAVALIANGVQFPPGPWIRVADATVLAWQVEEMLGKVFPDLKGKLLTYATLASESDVGEFERLIHPAPG